MPCPSEIQVQMQMGITRWLRKDKARFQEFEKSYHA